MILTSCLESSSKLFICFILNINRPLCKIWKLKFWLAQKSIQSTWLGQVNFNLGVFWYFSKFFCILFIVNTFSTILVHAFSWKSHFLRQIKLLSCVMSYFGRNLHSKMNWFNVKRLWESWLDATYFRFVFSDNNVAHTKHFW